MGGWVGGGGVASERGHVEWGGHRNTRNIASRGEAHSISDSMSHHMRWLPPSNAS